MKYIFKPLIISLLVLMVGAVNVSAQQSCDSVAVYFRQGKSDFEREFRDNGDRIDNFIARIRLIQDLSNFRIHRVEYTASASPEGTVENNERLASSRASVMTAILHEKLVFADSLVHLNAITEDWEGLARQVKADQNVPDRKEALRIIEGKSPDRKEQLRNLNGGAAWDYLLRTHFPDLRSFRIFIYTGIEEQELEGVVDIDLSTEPVAPATLEKEAVEVIEQPVVEQTQLVEEPVQQIEPQENKWVRKLTVKTNLVGAAFLMANAAVEVDIIENLSVALPVYWSGWDYAGDHTLKFRTLMIQPEVRYYIPKTNGLYVGAHFGMGYWNFALGDYAGKIGLDHMDGWRYQDHKGESPAIGGGISVGYALQFKKNPRWGMEFAVGAGAYDAKYDVFYNEANGPYHERGARTTFIGIDNAAISFTYKFDLKKANGAKKSDRKAKEGQR